MDARSPRWSSRVLPAVMVAVALLALASLTVAGCGDDETTTTAAAPSTTVAPSSSTTAPPEAAFPVTVTDDNGTQVTVKTRPERIVSTAPANTETLFALGAGDRVVGVTSLDDYPPEVASIAKIGDFQPNVEAITALQPDLIVAYSGNEEALKPLADAGTPVLILNPTSLDGIYKNIETIAVAAGEPQAAIELIDSIRTDIEGISNTADETGESPRVFYALDNTLWTPGPGSFVDELLTLAAATNVAGEGPDAYFQYTPEELVAADPELVLLPGTVFASADEFSKDPRFAGLTAVKEGAVKVIDDVIVTRPGPRVAEGLLVLATAVHPDAF